MKAVHLCRFFFGKMKTKLLVSIFFISVLTYSQFQRGFVPSEIHFKNGTIQTGFIYDDFGQNDNYGKSDYKSNSGINLNTSMGSYYTFNSFNTIIKIIHFKETENSPQQTDFDSDSIEFINVTREKYQQKYKTVKVVRANLEDDINVKFDTLKRVIWLPVREEGKVNMYGYFSWYGKKKNSWAEVYFQKQGNEFAINPIQTQKIFVGLEKQRPQIRASLLEIFGDCERFKSNIETIIDEYGKNFYSVRNSLSDEEKSMIKKQPKEKRDRMEFELREKKSFLPYENLLKKYYNDCGK